MSKLAAFAHAPAAPITLVMACVFSALGVILPYLPRWLEFERGLDGADLGAVLSVAHLCRIAVGPLIAMWADSARDRRTPIWILGLAALGAYAAFFFLAEGFWALMAVGFVALTLTQAVAPFVEAGVLRATARGGMPYGVARGIGSISFIVANIAGGMLIARFGLGAVVVWTLAAYACTALSARFALAPDPAPAPTAGASAGDSAGLAELLGNRTFVILIAACGLIQASHAFLYGFATLVWRGQGVSSDIVGLLWAFGTAVEVVFLWSLAPIERRLSPRTLILIGAGGAFLRWTLMGLDAQGWALWPLQALHALSFAATHVGAMRLIFRVAPERVAGLAQTLYATLAAGVLLGLATLASGALYKAVGAQGYWLMAAMALGGGALATLLRDDARP